MLFSKFFGRRVTWGLTAALLGLQAMWVQAQSNEANTIVVVTRRDAEIDKLSLEQVSRIFLGQLDVLPSGVSLTPVDAPETSALYADFYSKVLGKSPAQVKAYRSRQSFAGIGVPPRQAGSAAQAFKMGSRGSLVIAYIHKSDVTDQTLVLLDTGK